MNFEDLTLHKIKEEENISDIIDLDLDKSPEDLVYEWDSKVRQKFKHHVVNSEQNLNTLMKWYIQMLKEEASNLEDYQTLKSLLPNHIQFFKLYFVDLNCCFVDNYLDNMEEILLFYVNLEVKSVPLNQKDGKRTSKKFLSTTCRKIISILHIYLLNREERIWHVVMKVKLNLPSERSKGLLSLLYGHFLTREPKEKSSDLEFCRAYILHQKWKTIRKEEEWEKMDQILYRLHDRTLESVKANRVLRQILLPQNNSILDTLMHISEKHLIITEEYFKYIKSIKIQENNASASSDAEIEDDGLIPDLVGESNDDEFERAYRNFVQTMSSVHLENRGSSESENIKVESLSEDEDCQIVEVTPQCEPPDDADIVHEILDDDDIEVIYFKKRDEKDTSHSEKKENSVSFLESIKVQASGSGVSTDPVSSLSNNTSLRKSKNSLNVESTSILSEPSPSTVKKKNVVSIETQTDEWHGMDDNNTNRTDQNDMCGNYYYYGLITPPSDQLRDERSSSITDSTKYPNNVYTNIARASSPDECDSLTKTQKSESSSSSTEEINTDSSSSAKSVHSEPALVTQGEYNEERSPENLNEDMTFANDTEPDTRQSDALNIASDQSNVVSRTPNSGCDENVGFNNDNEVESGPHNSEVNNTAAESCSVMVDEGRTTPQEHAIPNTSAVTYSSSRSNSRSPSPFIARVQSTPEPSVNPHCSSTDTIDTSQGSPDASNNVFNNRNKLAEISSTSPHVTSTSTDAQDFGEDLCNRVNSEEETANYNRLSTTMTEAEEGYPHNESFCSEDYVEYSESNVGGRDFECNENVTQSNLDDGEDEEIFIEDTILMTDGEELSYIVGEALPIGANVNICMEELSAQSSCLSEPATSGTPQDDKEDEEEKEKRSDLSLSEVKTRGRWNKLQESYNLDEMFSGPVSKISGNITYVNPDESFDIFNSNTCEVSASSRTADSLTQSTSEVTSPAYEEIDDFRTYYEENKNSTTDVSTASNSVVRLAGANAIHPEIDCVRLSVGNGRNTGLLVPKTLKSLQDVSQSSKSSKTSDPMCTSAADIDKMQSKIKHVKRVQIAETIMDSRNSVPQPSKESTEIGLRGILKNPLPEKQQRGKRRTTAWRIPKRMMNLKSLAQYNVKPDDSCIQGVPCVIVERLSDSEISQWLRVSEISRKVRLEIQQSQYSSAEVIRIDYNKQSSSIGKNDMVRYVSFDDRVAEPVSNTYGPWRSNAAHTTSTNRNKGRVPVVSDDRGHCNILQPCTHWCCKNICENLSSLCITKDQGRGVSKMYSAQEDVRLNLQMDTYNPFGALRPAIKINSKPVNSFAQRDETAQLPDADIDIDATLDHFSHFNPELNKKTSQLPALIPSIEDFEKTLKLEEIKNYPIPADLHNLNLRKFSPSPVIHCFSPQSDSFSHSYFADSCLLDKSSSFGERETPQENKSQKVEDVEATESTIGKARGDTYPVNTGNLNSCTLLLTSDLNTPDVTAAVKLVSNDSSEYEESVPLDARMKGSPTVVEKQAETRLPLKKRKLSVAKTNEGETEDDDFLGPDLVEEIIKRARAEKTEREDISYPAKPMISIAEVQEKLAEPQPRLFKTPAERKEMPPPPVHTYSHSAGGSGIVTEQYNNHTYNNPTINYHMNNVPYPFFHCATLPYFPPILLPLNSRTTVDVNLINTNHPPRQAASVPEETPTSRRERRSRGKKKNKN